MKVSFLGAGAIGAMLGGLLKRDAPDIEVVLIARGDHASAMAKRGAVTLDGPWGTRDVPIAATADPAAVAGSQVVIVTVKSQDTESAAEVAAPQWGDATIVSIQNGINDQRLLKFVAPERLVMGMTATNMALIEPGRVSLQLGGATIFGPPAGHGRNQAAIAQAVGAAELFNRIQCPSLRFMAHSQALGVRYNKLAINALGYASSLSASNFITQALAYRPWRRSVGMPIVTECRQVFDRAKVELARIPGVPGLGRLVKLMKLFDAPVAGTAVEFAARRLFNRRPIIFSLQQDIARRKPTEIDYVEGEIVRLAESCGTSAPACAVVVQLVRELESRGDGTFFSRGEVIRRFEAANLT